MSGACCDSCAQGGPCAGGCDGGHGHGPDNPEGRHSHAHAMAPVRNTAAGQGLAHFLVGDGSRVLTIDCGGVAARMLVEHMPGGGAVRLTGQAQWGEGDRWARAVIEVDAASFGEACAMADAHGGLPRLAGMIERASGRLLSVGLESRPILGRGYP